MTHLAIPRWVDDAVCSSTDAAAFDQGADNYRHALAICAHCTAIELCREYAINDPTLQGVWGGTTTGQRQQIRVRRAIGGSTDTRCGSLAGYKAHITRKTTPCDQCKAANAAYQRDKRARHAEQPVTAPWTSTHGTEAGYKAHRRHGTDPCTPCIEGMREASRRRKAQRKVSA